MLLESITAPLVFHGLVMLNHSLSCREVLASSDGTKLLNARTSSLKQKLWLLILAETDSYNLTGEESVENIRDSTNLY